MEMYARLLTDPTHHLTTNEFSAHASLLPVQRPYPSRRAMFLNLKAVQGDASCREWGGGGGGG
jgi:hypothetical protein